MPELTRRRFLTGTAAAVGAWSLGAPALAGAPGPGTAPAATHAPDVLTGWVRTVYERVRFERLTPPAAARAYACCALAGYEAVVGGMPHHRSLGGQLNDLAALRSPGGLNWSIAANAAIATTVRAAFADRSAATRDAFDDREAALAARLAAGVPAPIVARSVDHGRTVGAALAGRCARDGYAETRNLPYESPVGPDKWERTPPNFGAALEPHWGRVLSFTLAANDECKPPAPVPYSESPGSAFWQQATTVHETAAALDDARRTTALFWRDNPDGTTGLPSGHWMLVACLVIEQEGLDLARAAEVLALLGIGLADAFTSCWTEKYQTNLVRPVTYIRRHIDPGWASFVNSPAFPEYTSGHSVGSGAAAEILTALLGDVPYHDDTGLANGYPAVRYASFRAAAEEAATSRLYGGIHFPMAIEVGLTQGIEVARKVLARARTVRHGPDHRA